MQFIGIIKATLEGLKKDNFKQNVDSVLDEYIAAADKFKESSCSNRISNYIAEKRLQEGR